MIWVYFLGSAALVFYGGILLARYGQALTRNTRLSGLWVGSILLAGATSLPEVITSISGGVLNLPNLSLGNAFGSNIFNLVIIAIMDFVDRRSAILAKVAPAHILAATLGMLLSSLAAIFILLRIKAGLFGVGFDSILLAAAYIFGLRLITRYEQKHAGDQAGADEEPPPLSRRPLRPITLRRAVFGLSAAAVLVTGAGFALSYSAGEVAVITGLGTTFVGSVMISFVTSLPELVTSVSAVRHGAADLAVGNILGSNIFNIFTIFLADLFYRRGPILAMGSQLHALTAMFGLLMSCIVVLGLFYRSKRKIGGVGMDSILIVLIYLAVTYMLYLKGM